MKKYYIILKSGYYLKCEQKATFNEKGFMNEQRVEIIRPDGFNLGDSDDFTLHVDEISLSFWNS